MSGILILYSFCQQDSALKYLPWQSEGPFFSGTRRLPSVGLCAEGRNRRKLSGPTDHLNSKQDSLSAKIVHKFVKLQLRLSVVNVFVREPRRGRTQMRQRPEGRGARLDQRIVVVYLICKLIMSYCNKSTYKPSLFALFFGFCDSSNFPLFPVANLMEQ